MGQTWSKKCGELELECREMNWECEKIKGPTPMEMIGRLECERVPEVVRGGSWQKGGTNLGEGGVRWVTGWGII